MIAALAIACSGPLAWLYRAYFATLRVRGLLADGSTVLPRHYGFGREIFALSERDALALAGIGRYAPMSLLVAFGRDGDWAVALLARLGFDSVRGSSLRGGARAAADLIRTLNRSERPAAIVVDGPLGPVGQAKPGTVVLGMRTRRPIRALGVAARRALVFRKTWSGIFLPLPFTRIVIACDDPLPAPAGAAPAEIAAACEQLTARLGLMRRRALAAVGRPLVTDAASDAAIASSSVAVPGPEGRSGETTAAARTS
jgi:lysophospholipid acyltransferase (LPLAT)-like uncharacterized protein